MFLMAILLLSSLYFPSASADTTPDAPFMNDPVARNAQVNLSWAVPYDHSYAIEGYNIYRGTAPGQETMYCTVTGPSTSSYTDKNLTNGQTYYYYIVAVNYYGASDPSNPVVATPYGPPGVPTALNGVPGTGLIDLSWTAPYDNGGSAITGYQLYWRNSPSEEFRVMSVSGMSLYHDGLVNGLPYYYKVTAINAAGEGPASDTVVATPAAKPAPPTGLTATGGDKKVVLTWTAPLEWANSNILGYRIYRGNSSLDLQMYDVSTDTTYTDTGVINGQTYYYRVSAINATGEGRMSNEANATPNVAPQDLMSMLGRYWMEILIIAIAMLVVVGVVFLMFGSGVLSLGKEDQE